MNDRQAPRRRRAGPPGFIVLLMAGNLAIGAMFVGGLLIWARNSGFIARQLSPGAEANVATWYSAFQWALAGLLLLAYARTAPPHLVGGLRLYLPAAAAFLLSIDETAAIHEWLGMRSDALLPDGTRAGTFFQSTGIWMLILVPFAVIAALWVARMLAEHIRAAPRAAVLLAIGGVLFIVGAGVMELLNNVGAGNRQLQVAVMIVEELFELMGATFVVWGAFELLRTSGIRLSRPGGSERADLADPSGNSS